MSFIPQIIESTQVKDDFSLLDLKKWIEFKQKYFRELDRQKEWADLMIQKDKRGNVILLFGAKEEKFNNAVALKEYIETKSKEVK
jgi:uncharacterized protein YeaO (DUF488 family)